MKRFALLAIAAVVYLLAAWMVAPGFYDGLAPPQPYNWTCPPPQAGANSKPSGGHGQFKVVGGESEAGSVATPDGQMVVGLLPGAFQATSNQTISVDIKPLDTCPRPSGVRIVTNVYQVTSSAPLNPGKSANVTFIYSNLEPDPSQVYTSADPGDTWTPTGSAHPGAPFTIVSTTTTFGYFAAGYPAAGSTAPGSVTIGGGSLPAIVAVLIVIVILGGLPIAVARRRRSR